MSFPARGLPKQPLAFRFWTEQTCVPDHVHRGLWWEISGVGGLCAPLYMLSSPTQPGVTAAEGPHTPEGRACGIRKLDRALV